eukprot:COSAG06_NODE_106_length_23773_cov_20.279083_13_plen_67_part_00
MIWEPPVAEIRERHKACDFAHLPHQRLFFSAPRPKPACFASQSSHICHLLARYIALLFCVGFWYCA